MTDDHQRLVADAVRAVAESEREELLTLKEFAQLFQRNYSALRRKARRGGWQEATNIAGQWWVRVRKRDADAMRNRSAA